MFEQAVLPAGPPSRRCWAMAIGVTGEVVVVVCALIHPGYLAAVAAAAEASHVVKFAGAFTGQTFTAGACAACHQALADARQQTGRAHSHSGQSGDDRGSASFGSGCRRRCSCR